MGNDNTTALNTTYRSEVNWFSIGVDAALAGWREPIDFLLAVTFEGKIIYPQEYIELARGFRSARKVEINRAENS